MAAAALAECMQSAAAALAVQNKLSVGKDSTAAAVFRRGLFALVAVSRDLSAAAASKAKAASRSPAEAVVASAMHCTPDHIGSCSRCCKQLVWERSSGSAA